MPSIPIPPTAAAKQMARWLVAKLLQFWQLQGSSQRTVG